MRTLLVMEAQPARDLLCGALEARSHSVIPVASADLARDHCLREGFPLLVLGRTSPAQGGAALCRSMRALPNGAEAFILCVTDAREEDTLRDLPAAGADDILIYPAADGEIQARLAIVERRIAAREGARSLGPAPQHQPEARRPGEGVEPERRAIRDVDTASLARLQRLQDVALMLAAPQTAADVLEVVVNRGCGLLGAVGGTIRLISDDGAWLERLEALNPPAAALRSPSRVALQEAHPICDAVRTGEPVWLSSPADWQVRYPALAGTHAAAGYAAGASIPMLAEGTVVGVLMLSFATSQRFDAPDREFLITLAQLAGQSVGRARLQATEREARRVAEELAELRQEQAHEAEALARVGAALGSVLDPAQLYTRILEQVATVLPCDQAGVVLYRDGWATVGATWGDPSLAVGTRIFPCEGPDRPWLPTDLGTIAHLPDTAAEPNWRDVPPWVGNARKRSLIAVPLHIDGVSVGFFDMTSTTPRAYTQRHLRLALLFGERVAQALRTARLYAAEQARARAAEELARLRSDFVATTSHELRTPLAAIVGYAELLQARWGLLDESQRRRYIDRIVLAANRQRRMVDDLLLLSRLEGSALSIQPTGVDLALLLRQAVLEVQADYGRQDIALDGPDDAWVVADADRLLQVVINLIDNAAKYSAEGSPVYLAWQSEAGGAAVRVRDCGPGVPLEGRERLFTRFGRLQGSRSRAGRVGTGLGLYLGRQLAEAMGGTLDLEQTGPAGSTFRLWLPRAPRPER